MQHNNQPVPMNTMDGPPPTEAKVVPKACQFTASFNKAAVVLEYKGNDANAAQENLTNRAAGDMAANYAKAKGVSRPISDGMLGSIYPVDENGELLKRKDKLTKDDVGGFRIVYEFVGQE